MCHSAIKRRVIQRLDHEQSAKRAFLTAAHRFFACGDRRCVGLHRHHTHGYDPIELRQCIGEWLRSIAAQGIRQALFEARDSYVTSACRAMSCRDRDNTAAPTKTLQRRHNPLRPWRRIVQPFEIARARHHVRHCPVHKASCIPRPAVTSLEDRPDTKTGYIHTFENVFPREPVHVVGFESRLRSCSRSRASRLLR